MRSVHRRVLPIALTMGLFGVVLFVLLAPGRGTAVAAVPEAISAPANIACLPFPQETVTDFNGAAIAGPYTSDTTSSFVTWRDESDSEDSYEVERRTNNGSWGVIATLPADSYVYQDTVPDASDTYHYRVRVKDGSDSELSASCRKPAWADSDDGKFRVFYRPGSPSPDCPSLTDPDANVFPICTSQATAQRIADLMQIGREQIMAASADGGTLKFKDPVANAPVVVDLIPCDGVGCARGSSFIALQPVSMSIPFDPATGNGMDSIWVPLHEIFHFVQTGLTDPASDWVREAQARAIEDKFCLDETPQNPCVVSNDRFVTGAYTWRIGKYLDNPNITLTEASYTGVLFWAYLMEQYGTQQDEPEYGLDILVWFWNVVDDVEHSDGTQVLDYLLNEMGYAGVTFEDVYKDFMVSNYAKDIPNAPAKYLYVDETQTPGSYGPVALTMDVPLTMGQQVLADSFVLPWAGRYFRFTPDATVPSIEVASQSLANSTMYYTLLAVKGNNIVEEINYTGPDFAATVANDDLDEVVLVVAGLDQQSNFNLAINGTAPELRIADPLTSRPAQGGTPPRPKRFWSR